MLALAEIQETRSCLDEEPRYGRRRHWESYELDEDEDDEDDDEPVVDDSEDATLGDLEGSTIDLRLWLDPMGKQAESVVLHIADEEACSTTPSSALHSYQTQHEGYMGNYGNTMDRWYRRAAIALWPQELGFAVRSEASPAWALKTLKLRIRGGGVLEAQEMASELLPFWEYLGLREEGRALFNDALRVAVGLEDSALAASLLRPFALESLAPGGAPAFVALLKVYGEAWLRSLLSEWATLGETSRRTDGLTELAWLTAMPTLCQALCGRGGTEGTLAVRLLLEDRWRRSKALIGGARGRRAPSERKQELSDLAKPILGFLEATAVAQVGDLRDEAVTFLCAEENESLLPLLVQGVRLAENLAPALRASTSFEAIVGRCVRRIEARLEFPERDLDDWSLSLSIGCRCDLCVRLDAFLTRRNERQLEWPLAKDGRRHVHDRLDRDELPVLHVTRRTGRPFTLVLTKTQALFAREHAERRALQADLVALKRWARATSRPKR